MTDTALTLFLVAGLSLTPVLLVVLSSYAKIAIVLTILRNGIGAPGVPPNLVIVGLSVLLTGVILAPVGAGVVSEARPHLQPYLETAQVAASERRGESLAVAAARAAEAASEPIRGFLRAHARPVDRQLFAELIGALQGAQTAAADDSLAVLAPAFAISELRSAFVIGVAVLLPFLVIDILVANVLVALGLVGLPAATVAVPLKLALFVTIEGWQLLGRGLISGYL